MASQRSRPGSIVGEKEEECRLRAMARERKGHISINMILVPSRTRCRHPAVGTLPRAWLVPVLVLCLKAPALDQAFTKVAAVRSPLEPGLVQVAGVADEAEAALLVKCGVRYLGFPLRIPVNREDLTEAEAAAIIRRLRPPVYGVLITYLANAEEIAEFADALGARFVQLHGDIALDELLRLREMVPRLTVIKSLVVGLQPVPVLERMVHDLAPHVDGFITDTFAPDTGASGATGRTHDWAVSRRLVELSERPVILAGGLTPANVRRAIVEVRPAGVDVHTGVEDESGRKSREKVTAFVRESKVGFRELGVVSDDVSQNSPSVSQNCTSTRPFES
jgi:phosphoribosylanthranilate isomerase